jgi:arylsulfatase/uncharacterized sulfatase
MPVPAPRALASLALAALLAVSSAAPAVGSIPPADAPKVATPAPPAAPARRPNIVMIVVDDAALMDFGAFGGEARTPNIDRLARQGAIFSAYHTSPLCSPSRAMLLTGLDNHRAGVATIEEVLPPSQKGKHGYGLHFEDRVWTIADRLKASGYRTLMSGKWHLGHGPGDLPNSHGFDRSLALDASGADNWAAKPYMPYYKEAPWFEDGQPAKMPKRYYSSDLIVDRMIGYLDEKPAGQQPFFAYIAFQAVHIPVQAPKAFSDHYKGQFDAGWTAVRKARAARAKAMGLIPANAPVADMPAFTRAWDSLPPKEKALYARTMEVYSGMLEAMDADIGKLMARLAERGELDNTLFVVTSDNGPEPTDPVHAPGMNLWMAMHGYNWSLKTMGEKGSLTFLSRNWAASLSAPGQLFKFYAAEGGVHVPLVISGPGVLPGGRIASPAFAIDITPTLADFAGAAPAPSALAMDGKSLKGVLTGAQPWTHPADEPIGLEVSGNSALFRGDYKITRNRPPIGDGKWRLYNLKTDPGETLDLSQTEPALYQSLLADYAAYEKRVGVAPLPPGYTTDRQLMGNALANQRGGLIGAGLVLVLAVFGGLTLMLRGRRKARR